MLRFPEAEWPAVPAEALKSLQEGVNLREACDELKTFVQSLKHMLHFGKDWCADSAEAWAAKHPEGGEPMQEDPVTVSNEQMQLLEYGLPGLDEARVALSQTDNNVMFAVNWWYDHMHDWQTFDELNKKEPAGEEPLPPTPKPPCDLPSNDSIRELWRQADGLSSEALLKLTPREISGVVPEEGLQHPHQVSDMSCMLRLVRPLQGHVVMSAEDVRSFASAPLSVLAGFSEFFTDTQDDEIVVETKLPFDLSQHVNAQVEVAKQFMLRTEQDMERYSQQVTGSITKWVRQLTAEDASKYVNGDLQTNVNFAQLQHRLQELLARLKELQEKDECWVMQALPHIISEMEYADPDAANDSSACHRFRLARCCRQQARLDLGFALRALLSTRGENDLLRANPFLRDAEGILHHVFASQLYCMRLIHANRCIAGVLGLQKTLNTLVTNPNPVDIVSSIHKLAQQSSSLATLMHAKRYSMSATAQEAEFAYDPRFLVFEYMFQYMLRKRQVEMTKDYLEKFDRKESSCQQMIMGAGKTTVIGIYSWF